MKLANFGKLSGATVGLFGKEAVRRAMIAIDEKRFIFEKTDKMSYAGEMNDMVTDADKAAQKIYEKMITEHFPKFGIIGEEDDLSIKGKGKFKDYYFTVDPLDGTKAFVRQQSMGIGTMLALAYKQEVLAVWIGDIATGEIYYYRPDSEKVHRLSQFNTSITLQSETEAPLNSKVVLLRDRVEAYSKNTRKIISKKAGLFKNIEIGGGSIGISEARLWKNEIGATILKPHFCTPWDWTPVYGISKKMGFVFLKPSGDKFEEYTPTLNKTIVEIKHDILVVHGAYKHLFI